MKPKQGKKYFLVIQNTKCGFLSSILYNIALHSHPREELSEAVIKMYDFL